MASSTLLLFGPQALLFDEQYFGRIRHRVTSNAENQWILDVLEDFPSHWPALCQKVPKFGLIPGPPLTKKLVGWLRTGEMGILDQDNQPAAHLPNVILSPLVVMAQLLEYAQLFQKNEQNRTDYSIPEHNTETLGFCLGILSAFAVSSSSTRAQFLHNGAAALRLAMTIGALVDANDAHHAAGPSSSLAAVWKMGQSKSDLLRVLEDFPEVSSLRGYTSYVPSIGQVMDMIF
jgi:malonyl CoA-acyl carrier protein transacylase